MLPSGLELLAIPAFIGGVLLLYKGSDILVDGTVKTAAQLGVSALIISVLLVGFGTSSPEFAISVGAAAQNNSDISLGNIIGSCVANLLLVLGIAAIIKPIKVKKGIIKREVPIMMGATVVLLIWSYFSLLDDYHLIGGITFLIMFAAFVLFFVHCARKERDNNKKYDPGKTGKNIMFIILGIAGVVVGAWLLIESSVTIAELLGIPAFIIALSIVAIGTSLPELVVSAMASYKGESDIAVGNVLGSNVFNILLILGFAALFIPLNATESLDHTIILLLVTLVMVPICCTKRGISRVEGIFMLVIYSVFIWYIFWGHEIIATIIG
jgi:cation:H+ antiporter